MQSVFIYICVCMCVCVCITVKSVINPHFDDWSVTRHEMTLPRNEFTCSYICYHSWFNLVNSFYFSLSAVERCWGIGKVFGLFLLFFKLDHSESWEPRCSLRYQVRGRLKSHSFNGHKGWERGIKVLLHSHKWNAVSLSFFLSLSLSLSLFL